jgi:hypothetical protein
MKCYKLGDMTKGWFVGNFSPNAFVTEQCEVAVKKYRKGDYEPIHHHRIATEITVVVMGCVKMGGRLFESGDIIVVEPFESIDFRALEDSVTTVVKIPGASNDKYVGSFND